MSNFSITCTKENLVTGLLRVSSVAGKNSQLPILQHILLQTKGGVLHLTSTDLELGIHTVVGGKTSGEGKVAVPAKSFLAYIQQLPPENPITLKATEKAVHVETSGFIAQFPIASADDFPLLPRGERKTTIMLPGEVFCRALQQVIFAAARDETRPEIRGVYVRIEDSHIRLAATDSFRLAEEVVSYNGSSEDSFILPFSAAQEVIKLFAHEENVSIAPQENHILIYSDEIDLSSRLIDGSYPDYQQIIPKSSSITFTASASEMLRALKTVSVFLPRDSRRVELDVQPKKGIVVARVAGGGAGEGVVEVPIEGEGVDVSVLVNIQYLLEGLQHVPDGDCVIGLSGDTSPITIQPDKKNNRYVYVVMPIRS